MNEFWLIPFRSDRVHSPEREDDSRHISPVRSSGRGRGYILAAGVFWSLSGVITKSLPLDPLTIAFYRGLFAGLALLPFVPPGRWVFRPVMIPLGLVFGAMTGLLPRGSQDNDSGQCDLPSIHGDVLGGPPGVDLPW